MTIGSARSTGFSTGDRVRVADTLVGSLFAGIGGFDLAAEQAGMRVVWQSEIEPFCRVVLKARFPGATLHGDIHELGKHNLEPVDVICAGVPCQDVSLAGKRVGLKGKRTGLFYQFARILEELRPSWFLFENVPGLLSSNDGRDFAEVQRVLMVECGYGICWRVLDSQFFGVAQRRRRVYVVGRLGEPCRPEVLFESEVGEGHPASGREEGQGVAAAPAGGAGIAGGGDIASTLRECNGPHGWSAGLRGDGSDNIIAVADTIVAGGRETGPHGALDGKNLVSGTFQNTGHGWWNDRAVAATIRTPEGSGSLEANLVAVRPGADDNGGRLLRLQRREEADAPGADGVTFALRDERGRCNDGRVLTEQSHTLHRAKGPSESQIVARFGDDGSASDADGVRDASGVPEGMDDPAGMDAPRYKALGNAVTVSAARWILGRIAAVQNL